MFQSSSPKSLLELRFTSLILPGTTAKESRIRLTLRGFTYNLTSDFGLFADITRFFNSPPGVRPFVPGICLEFPCLPSFV